MKLTLLILFVLAVSLQAIPSRRREGPRLPYKLECTREGSKTKEVLYTRLENVSVDDLVSYDESHALVLFDYNGDEKRPIHSDEVAIGWAGDNFKVSVDSLNWHYDLWTCDTEDRSYTVAVRDLVRSVSATFGRRPIAAELILSVREDSETFKLSCVAFY